MMCAAGRFVITQTQRLKGIIRHPVARRLLIFLCAGWTLCFGAAFAETVPMGSLLLHKSVVNGRYFAMPNDRLVYLQGGYEGSELQDYVFDGSLPSDFQKAMDLLARYDGNLLRLWTSESSGRIFGETATMSMPWIRSALCCAADGGHKFDLARLDVGNLAHPSLNSIHYFERMRARVMAARVAGIKLGRNNIEVAR